MTTRPPHPCLSMPVMLLRLDCCVLQAELEVKVKMLLLPVGILAQHATQGNTVSQEGDRPHGKDF